MKVIDCFTFNSELECLRIRLRELDPIVTHVVLVEGTKSQSGQDKSLIYQENKHLFKEYNHKITHIVVNDWPALNGQSFQYDIFQRDQIKVGLEQIGLEYDSITLISDCDEICRRETLEEYLKAPKDLTVFQFDYFCYKFNLRAKKTWNGTVAIRGKMPLQYSCHALIKLRDKFDDYYGQNYDKSLLIKNAGWHLGYSRDCRRVWEGYFQAAEPLRKESIPPWEEFEKIYNERVRDGGFFIYCDQLGRLDLGLEEYPIEKLPREIVENQDKYKELLWKE